MVTSWYLSSSILAMLYKYASHLNMCQERTKGWGLIFNSVNSPHYISPSQLFIAACCRQENIFLFSFLLVFFSELNGSVFLSHFQVI